MKTKRCCRCGEVKLVKYFNFNKKSKDGYSRRCKSCKRILNTNYQHSKKGVVSFIYAGQVYSSKIRNYNSPNYTKKELEKWLFDQSLFHELYDNWVKSEYTKDLKPSVDRKDDYKTYTLDNIQLMTWRDNNKKGVADRINGINNKISRAVLQYDLDGNFIAEYYSQMQAGRETGISNVNIWGCCKGLHNTAGGYRWEYK